VSDRSTAERAVLYLAKFNGRIYSAFWAAVQARREGQRELAREIIRQYHQQKAERKRLVRRRVELNRIIRDETMIRNAYPHLADKPWAKFWRRQFIHPHDRVIRTAKTELATINKQIGPPPRFWKPRNAPGLDRLRRLFPNKPSRTGSDAGNAPLFCGSWRRER
jgi:hypothetical protein